MITSHSQNSPPSLVCATFSQSSVAFMLFSRGHSFHLYCRSELFHDKIFILHYQSEAWWWFLLVWCHHIIYRGYYTVARRYEFYVRVARTIFHKWAQRTSEILFLPREHKIHIFEPTCNVLKEKEVIVTSLNDTTLAKVTYGKYPTQVPYEVAYGIYEWLSSQ